MSSKNILSRFGDWLDRGNFLVVVLKSVWVTWTPLSFIEAGYRYYVGEEFIGPLLFGIILLVLGLMIFLDGIENSEKKKKKQRIENLEERIRELEKKLDE